jgi:hypothetical protein
MRVKFILWNNLFELGNEISLELIINDFLSGKNIRILLFTPSPESALADVNQGVVIVVGINDVVVWLL